MTRDVRNLIASIFVFSCNPIRIPYVFSLIYADSHLLVTLFFFFSVEREKRAKIRMNFEIAKDRHEIKLNSEKQ